MARTGLHPWLRPGWNIPLTRIGYCSNTNGDGRFRCEDNNVAFTSVQPHYYCVWQVEPCHPLSEVARCSSWTIEHLTLYLNNKKAALTNHLDSIVCMYPYKLFPLFWDLISRLRWQMKVQRKIQGSNPAFGKSGRRPPIALTLQEFANETIKGLQKSSFLPCENANARIFTFTPSFFVTISRLNA